MNQSLSEPTSMEDQSVHTLGTWTRIYVHGCLAFLFVYAAAYVVTRLLPIFETIGNPVLAVALSILTILIAPPLVGSLVLYGVFPMLGTKKSWRGLKRWSNRVQLRSWAPTNSRP